MDQRRVGKQSGAVAAVDVDVAVAVAAVVVGGGGNTGLEGSLQVT